MSGLQVSAMSSIDEAALCGILVTANEAFILASLNGAGVVAIRNAVQADAHWGRFVRLVAAGLVPADWMPGAVGRCVLGWARQAADPRDVVGQRV